MIKTRSQQFAEKAFSVVDRWKNAQNSCAELKSFARSFPALVQTCGLLQALAYAQEKNEAYFEGFRETLEVIESVGKIDVEKLCATNSIDYMRVGRLALEAATWIKRYAVVLLDDDGGSQ